MFFQQIESWIASVVAWWIGLVDFPPIPAWLGSGGEQLAVVLSHGGWLCNFVDFSMWRPALTVMMVVWFTSLGIRLARIALGYFIG